MVNIEFDTDGRPSRSTWKIWDTNGNSIGSAFVSPEPDEVEDPEEEDEE